jgi:hypothetical protein
MATHTESEIDGLADAIIDAIGRQPTSSSSPSPSSSESSSRAGE